MPSVGFLDRLFGAASDEPELSRSRERVRSLARLATRAELRRPGTLERSFGGMSRPAGSFATGFLGVFAGLLVGSAVAERFFDDAGPAEALADEGGEEDVEAGDADSELGGDFGGGDFGDFGGF